MKLREPAARLRRARPSPWTAAALLLALVSLVTDIGRADVPDPEGVIHACYDEDGKLRVNDTASVPGTCGALEDPLVWDQRNRLMDFNVVARGITFPTSSTTFVGVESTTITVPPGRQATILATFTAESACYGASAACSVEILLDGVPMLPDPLDGFAFDSSDNNSETNQSWESHSVTRTINPIDPGTHKVEVQARVSDAAAVFELDDYVLVVQAIG